MDLQDIRKDYKWGALLESGIDENPIAQFRIWYKEYATFDTVDNTAMILSTIDLEGVPQSRVVLLKELHDEDGFIFYSNYNSTKGKSMARNPKVSLLFFWPEMERQIRVIGTASQLDKAKCDAYFNSRPFESRVSAIISPQSEIVPDREYLENRMFNFLQKHEDGAELKRPPNWGGYAIKPMSIEFWQGRPSRLHDRLRYAAQANGSWKIERLAP